MKFITMYGRGPRVGGTARMFKDLMRTDKFLFIAAFLAICPAQAFALDLDGCVSMALAASHALRSSEQKINSARSAYSRDRRSLFPVLSVSGEDGYNRYQAGSGLRDGLTGTTGARFSLDLKKNLSDYPELSRLELEKSRIQRDLAEKDIVRSVTQDYYRLYILLGKRADYSEARKYFSSHIEDIEKLENAGLDLKLDRVRAEIQLKSLELTARDLDTDIDGVLRSLSSATGAELRAEDLTFQGGPESFGRLPGQDGIAAISTCCAGAEGVFSARLDRLETNSAYETYRQSRFSYAPTLELGVARNLAIIDPATELYRTYIAVSLDVFDFGARAEERKAYLHDYEARKEAELENQKQLRLSLDRLAAEMNGAAVSYDGLKKNYEAAAGNLETAKLYYTKGKIKETDLLSIFSEYLDAKQQSRDALGRYLDTMTELAYLRAGAEK